MIKFVYCIRKRANLTDVGGRLIDWDQIRIEDNRETLQLLC
jgi:hypothetical protein